MNGNGTARVVDLEDSFVEEYASANHNACNHADDHRCRGTYECARRSDSYQSRKHSIASHGYVRLAKKFVPQKHRCGRACHCREICIHRYNRDAKVRGTERRAGIEAHPPKEQKKRAGNDEHNVGSRECARLSVRTILAIPWPKDQCQRHSAKASDTVDHR